MHSLCTRCHINLTHLRKKEFWVNYREKLNFVSVFPFFVWNVRGRRTIASTKVMKFLNQKYSLILLAPNNPLHFFFLYMYILAEVEKCAHACSSNQWFDALALNVPMSRCVYCGPLHLFAALQHSKKRWKKKYNFLAISWYLLTKQNDF